ncbi:MAG: helix-turn-helix domain-containing protein [Flavobacteriales bacterium]
MKWSGVIAIWSAITLLVSVGFLQNEEEVSQKHLEVVLREIGHELLLAGGDSVSHVLPVKMIKQNTYQISFESSFRFWPDSLIKLTKGKLEKYGFSQDYIVNVKECKKQETIYAFEIRTKEENILPCTGREQGLGCYDIQIEFIQKEQNRIPMFMLMGLPVILAGIFIRKKYQKKEKQSLEMSEEPFIAIGDLKLYPERFKVAYLDQIVELTENESKALKIFSQNVNAVVEREELMKEIWEDRGLVVISRNVDVLVSKLRKKLSFYPAIKITNVHGRGYRLTIED